MNRGSVIISSLLLILLFTSCSTQADKTFSLTNNFDKLRTLEGVVKLTLNNEDDSILDAGKIWPFIDSNGECTFKKLKKVLQLKEPEPYLAIGWLSSERKIRMFERDENRLIISLYKPTK